MLIGLQIAEKDKPLDDRPIYELDDFGDFKMQEGMDSAGGSYLELYAFQLSRPFQTAHWQGIDAFLAKIDYHLVSLDGSGKEKILRNQNAWLICENPEDVESAEIFIQEEVMYKT